MRLCYKVVRFKRKKMANFREKKRKERSGMFELERCAAKIGYL